MLDLTFSNIIATIAVCIFISVNSKLIEDIIKFRLSWSWLPQWLKDNNPDNPRDWWHIFSWFNFIHWVWASVYWVCVYLDYDWFIILITNIILTIILLMYFQVSYHYVLMKKEHRDLKDRGLLK